MRQEQRNDRITETGAVDVHVHVTLPSLLSRPDAGGSWSPTVHFDRTTGRQVSVEINGKTMSSIVNELTRLEIILEGERDKGIEKLVISPWVSTLPREMEAAAAADVCRLQNAALADAVRQHHGSIAAFGAVPMQEPNLAAEMLAEVLAAGLVGVEVTPSAEGRWLGDLALAPFWEAADELGLVVFVHPGTRGLGLDVFNDFYLWNAVANPVETATAAAHLIMAGTFERYKKLRVLLAHGGGVLPAIVGRLNRAWAVRTESREQLVDEPKVSFARLHFDTVTHDRATLASLVAMVGADHVMLGTDHPFDMGTDDPIGDVRALGLSPKDENLVLRGNASAFFPATGGDNLEAR